MYKIIIYFQEVALQYLIVVFSKKDHPLLAFLGPELAYFGLPEELKIIRTILGNHSLP